MKQEDIIFNIESYLEIDRRSFDNAKLIRDSKLMAYYQGKIEALLTLKEDIENYG